MLGLFGALLFAAQAAPAEPVPCTEADSISATVVEIAGDPGRFLDRCVTVSGAVAGIEMYSGQEGMYLAYRFGADGNHTPEGQKHRIGIDRQDIRDLRMAYPQRTTVTGRVDSCERRYERIRAAGGIPFLGGYCHYFGGPTIVVDAYSITEKRYERMTGEDARRRFGNLAFMPEDWPARPAILSITAELLAALRAGDRAKVAELHDFRNPHDEHERAILYRLLEDSDSAFAQVRSGPVQTAYFVASAEGGSVLGGERSGAGGIACFCRIGDCSDRWPITLNDTVDSPGRPFACTRIETYEHATRPHFYTERQGGWTTEPSVTAVYSGRS